MATKEKPVKVTTFSYLTDKFAAGAARVNGGEYPDIDIAVVKATNHDLTPPKEKHVRTLRETIAGAPSRRKIIYMIHDLYERMSEEKDDWLVVMKTLMVFHRLMKADGEGTFKLEMIKYKEKRKLTTLIRMDNFTDHSTPEAWDYSAFIRVYSIYLDERMEVFQSIKFDIERDVGDSGTKLKVAPTPELLDQLPRIQKLLNRVLACLPEGASVGSIVIMESTKWILSECFRVYRAISEGVINLADQFFDMDRIDARKGLEMYREAIESTERLQSFFNAIQSMPAGNQMTFPQLQPPPSDFLTQMEEYVKGAKGPEMAKTPPAATIRPRNLHSDMGSAVLRDPPKPSNDEPDLLDMSSFEPEASKAENVSVTGSDFMNAPVANDPFGDSAFSAIPNQSSEQSTPPPGGQPAQPSYQPDSAPVQSAPTNSILDDFLDLSINPTPPQTGFQNGGMNFGSQAPSGMTPFDMHPNPGNTGFAPAPGFGGHNMGTANAFDQPAVADGGNPFGTASFGFQNPSNPATMNPPMNVGMGMAQPMGNPSMNPGMGMGTGTGVNYAMSGAARSSPVPANPVMVGDPFLTLSTEAGIRSVNPTPVPSAPMRPDLLQPPSSGNPFGADPWQQMNSNPTAGAGPAAGNATSFL